MPYRILLASLLVVTTRSFAVDWLTIAGDPTDATADTIQMDPVAGSVDGSLRTMGIRVSRSVERTSAAGSVFRSFEGAVEFDCDKQTARFVSSQFYRDPLWKTPRAFKEFPATEVRPMAFRLFEPNPRERVIRAACQAYLR
jgi:hypothetical protein